MAVRIRLRRVGSSKNPIWRIVVADRRSPRDGRMIETIGHYNPQTDPSTITIDTERARHWLDHGARPSKTAAVLLRTQGIETSGSNEGSPLSAAAMRDLVEFLAKSLVEDPGAVSVEEVIEDDDLVLEITVADDDLGRVIGRGGRIANALRTVAKAAGTRTDRRVVVEILE